MNQQILEETIARFEQRFLAGDEPDIVDFASPDQADKTKLFAELLHTDMELRLRSGQNARVEEYIERFPNLAAQKDLIEELLKTEHKVRSKFEPGLRMREYAERFPQYYQSLPPDLSVEHSTVLSSSGSDTLADPIEESCSDFSSRFRKRRLHKQGGLGNLWIAQDRELKRKVAIKEIKEKYTRSVAHRARFKREQIITSKLDHPGIVPIYGVGYFPDGTPYYAMQFIDGMTLTEAVEQFHDDTNSTGLKRQLNFRRLLQHFIDACNTIDYAHSQSVIHRDIKPANIMIGQFGETYVVDWGLAKMETDDSDLRQLPDNSLAFEEESVAVQSNAGQSIGSPGYMSPEQRNGDIEAISRQSDVYGLGATLWKIITGKTPTNKESDIKAMVDSKPAMYQPLISICTKAMSIDPENRYQSAKKLSEEIQTHLSNELVEGHQYSWLERIHQLTRKHYEVVSVASIAAVLFSAILSMAAIWINLERQQVVAAREAETIALKKSEDSRMAEATALLRAETRKSQLVETIQVFSDLFAGTDDSGLAMPNLQTTLHEALDEMKLRVNQYDTPIQSTLFAIFARNSKSRGQYEQAIIHYKRSLELLEKCNIAKNDAIHLDGWIGLAFTYIHNGDVEKAKEIHDRIESIIDIDPKNLELQEFKLKLLSARMNSKEGKFDEAAEQINKSLELATKIYPDTPNHNNILWAKFRLASLVMSERKLDKAATIFQELVDAFENKEEKHPIGVNASVQLAIIEYTQGNHLSAIERMKTAYLEMMKMMGSDHPDTVVIQTRYAALMALQKDSEKRDLGIEELEKCRKIQMESLGLTHPQTIGTNCVLASVLLNTEDSAYNNRSIEITGEYFLGATPLILQAAKADAPVAARLARIYVKGAVKTGQLETAVKRIAAADENTDAIDFSPLTKKWSGYLEQQKQQTQQQAAGN